MEMPTASVESVEYSLVWMHANPELFRWSLVDWLVKHKEDKVTVTHYPGPGFLTFTAHRTAEPAIRRYIGTITRHQTDHKGMFHFELVGGDLGGMSHANACWAVVRALGHVMPQDYGKRAYLVGDVVQVENDEQRAERLRKA